MEPFFAINRANISPSFLHSVVNSLPRFQQLTLKDTRSLPVQVDGEPWEEGPCVITITRHNQALMLSKEEKQFLA